MKVMDAFMLESAADAYRKARAELLEAEKALRDQREAVAEMRRKLPQDTPVKEDYAFTEIVGGKSKTVRLSELFGDHDTLIVMHYMWAPRNDSPCPMCSMWTDGYDAVQAHLAQRAAFVVAAKQDAAVVAEYAKKRGWANTRFVSTGGTSFNADFGMEDGEENQYPGVSVFTRGADGTVRHFYTVSALMGDGTFRGMDILSPVWHYFDLLPQGRGDFFPALTYD